MTAAEPDAGQLGWEGLLRACGLRATPARCQILSSLQVLRHGTPEQIYALAEPRLPGLNLSTVYRTLEVLHEHGVVAHTHLVGHSTTYMLRDHADHVHLVCRSCDAVTELDAGLAAAFTSQVLALHHFQVDEGHLSVFGWCDTCGNSREVGESAASVQVTEHHTRP